MKTNHIRLYHHFLFTLFAFIALAVLTYGFLATHAQAEDPRSILKNITASFRNHGSFQAALTITSGGNVSMKGLVKYAQGKMRIDLSEPAGKKIVTNGQYLWIYDQNRKSVGRQAVFGRKLSGGLYYLNGYSQVNVLNQPNGYLVRLFDSSKHWQKVVIRAGGNYFPSKITLTDADGYSQVISFTGIRTGLNFPGKEFDFRIPGDIQMVENPLNLK